MFLNFSNHPSSLWSKEQLFAAKRFGDIKDIPFPKIDALADEDTIEQLADKYAAYIIGCSNKDKLVVHIMGETTFTYALIKRLRVKGVICVASTTERIVNELGDGRKESIFKFIKFRQYE